MLGNKCLPLFLILVLVTPIKAEEASSNHRERAQYQANLGAYYWQKAEELRAIEAWSKEEEIYELLGLEEKKAETSLKIAVGYTNLGKFELARGKLEKILKDSIQLSSSLMARTWEKLGNVETRIGSLSEAIEAYEKSLKIEESLSTLNNLTVVLEKKSIQEKLQAHSSRKGKETEAYEHKAQLYREYAQEYAKEALALSKAEESLSSIRALIEWAKLSKGLSVEEIERGRKILEKVPSSKSKVFLVIKWAELDLDRRKYWLDRGREIAKKLGDAKAESYVLVELGKMYEESKELEMALKYAGAAQLKAQWKFAWESLYQAQWLAGKSYEGLGNKQAAKRAYREAIASLDAFNQGLTKISVERRKDFRNEIEPIYRRMLELLLSENEGDQSNLVSALLIFDKLRLAQMQTYFGDNCFEVEVDSSSDTLRKENAVIINSIILENKTHFILQLPNGRIDHSKSKLGKTQINKIAGDWYKNLKETNSRRFKREAQIFYHEIISPFSDQLEQINPSVIIFVHDGILRNLPMAAMFDGEKFLAEKWASISSVGFRLKSTRKKENNKRAVAFGLSIKRKNWSELTKVPLELEEVIKIVGGNKFLNQEFTTKKFAKQIKETSYWLLHLATHGYFGGTAENSFLVAYDKRLTALELKDYLNKSKGQIRLIVLSACETAVSSDRSALGLAGVALRSGVEYVLGSLWQVQDENQLELMKDFYYYIEEENQNFAQALQKIQLKQIEKLEHPSHWASLNLAKN